MTVDDPIERGEKAAARFADDYIDGDRFLCPGCDEWAEIADAVPESPAPYAPPICLACAGLQHGGS